MTSHKDRLELAWMIRDRLPWASVVAGAKGYNFIDISRGETITGSDANSAWSRAVPGSFHVQYESSRGYGGEVKLYEYLLPKVREHSRERFHKYLNPVPPKKGGGWMETAADCLAEHAAANLPAVDPATIVLAKGERFEIRIHELEPRAVACPTCGGTGVCQGTLIQAGGRGGG